MDQSINWVNLVKQDRAKAMGIPWTAEEAKLVNAWKKDSSQGIHPDDVRSGKYLDKKKNINSKPTHHLKKDELIVKAKELEIEFDEQIVQRADLILLINQKIKNEKDTKEGVRTIEEDGGVEK
jgi:hypothetical protein